MTDAKTAELVVQKLDLAIATASNDDYSKPMTTERFRHSERIAAMAEGRDLIRAQAKEIEGLELFKLAVLDILQFRPESTGVDNFEQIARHARATALATAVEAEEKGR